MTTYEKNIDEWIYLIRGNHIEHCREQELSIENNIIPVLERPDVYVDEERIRKGLSLQKYFDFNLLPWERYQFAIMFGVFLRVPGAPYDDIYFHVTRDIMGRGSGKNGFIDFCALYMISPLHGVKNYNVDLIANGEDQAGTSIKDVSNLVNEPTKAAYAKVLKANFKGMAEMVLGNSFSFGFIFFSAALQGLFAELPFAVTRYRVFNLPMAMLSGLCTGIEYGVYLMLFRYQGVAWFSPRGIIHMISEVVGGVLIAGVFSWFLYIAIAKTGVLDRFASGRAVRFADRQKAVQPLD